jgi:hypothetical protein
VKFTEYPRVLMTVNSLRATTPDAAGWLADLKCQETRTARAAFLLEHAVETLREEQPTKTAA